MFRPELVRSATFLRTLEEVGRLARNSAVPILIEGESGTGKTLLARHIHELSPRARSPFERVLLSALDDNLASSDLFGHLPGAFTDARGSRSGSFVSSHGGTLFLDEIGKASFGVQQKLLHAVEYGTIRPLGSDRDVKVDTRIVFANNVPLARLVEVGTFLPDLHARIETFTVVLPPLRSRRADIPVLVEQYVAHDAPICGYGSEVPAVSQTLMAALQYAQWPNNLRQLHATVRRLLVEADGAPELVVDHCRGPLEYLAASQRDPNGPTLEQINEALSRSDNNTTQAARALGIDRTTLYRRKRRLKGDTSAA
jgi:DNA-binding NtrC family response regulator